VHAAGVTRGLGYVTIVGLRLNYQARKYRARARDRDEWVRTHELSTYPLRYPHPWPAGQAELSGAEVPPATRVEPRRGG
jgi:hypothetical protein